MLVSKLVSREAMQKVILGQISLQLPSRLKTALLDNKDILKLNIELYLGVKKVWSFKAKNLYIS